jgi:hypothetical protein
MRGYPVIVGAIAWLSWSCQLQSTAVCSPAEERCACVDNHQCSAGLTCVSGTCFDLSNWFAVGTAGAAGFGMSVLPGEVAGSGAAGVGGGVPPGVDPNAPQAGELAAGSGAAGTAGFGTGGVPGLDPNAQAAGSGSAGVPASTCAALSGDCSAAPCCGDAVCVLGVCAARCKVHLDCTSGCCIAHDATLATCFAASACVAPAR